MLTEGKGRTVVARVVSDKMQKSFVALIERHVRHPKIGKVVRRSTKIHVHDEENLAQLGDVVLVKECRPVSKTKTWVLMQVMERVAGAAEEVVG